MRRLLTAVLLPLVTLLSGCGQPTGQPQAGDLIAGRWEGSAPNGRRCALELTSSGTIRVVKPYRGAGKYLLAEDGLLQVEIPWPNGNRTAKFRTRVTRDELTLEKDAGQHGQDCLIQLATYHRVDEFSPGVVRTVEELIVGRWKSIPYGKQRYSFTSDGTFTYAWDKDLPGYRPFPNPLTGKYALLEEGKIRLDPESPGVQTVIRSIVVEEDALALDGHEYSRGKE
jgi:hypothetical protein